VGERAWTQPRWEGTGKSGWSVYDEQILPKGLAVPQAPKMPVHKCLRVRRDDEVFRHAWIVRTQLGLGALQDHPELSSRKIAKVNANDDPRIRKLLRIDEPARRPENIARFDMLGCDLEVFGPEVGLHARSSIGVVIPLNAPVNCEAEVEIDGG
jgi:hypothetical protein